MSGRQRQVEEFEEEQHRHDVHDDDRDAPAHPTTSQPADRRVQQIDEQQPEHEGPDSIPRHPQQQPDEDRRADEHGDARRHRNESRVVAVGRGVDERGRGERGDPLRRRGGGRPLGLVHRSGRLADVSELPDAAARAPPALASRRRPGAGCVADDPARRGGCLDGGACGRWPAARRGRGRAWPVATQLRCAAPRRDGRGTRTDRRRPDGTVAGVARARGARASHA